VSEGTVTVRDYGQGIDAADLPHIFDRFYRPTAARTTPGSGLGLAIVRQVAEAHGGTVGATRAAGGGSLFTLRLPTSEAAADEIRMDASDRPSVAPGRRWPLTHARRLGAENSKHTES